MLGLGRSRKVGILPSETSQLKFQVSVVRDGDDSEDLSRCEDAEPVIERTTDGRVFLCVADGLGGYSQGFDGKTGGYIASRVAIKAAVDYFCYSAGFSEDGPDTLTNHIYRELRNLAERKLPPSRVRGTLGRHKLATTLAAVVFDDSLGTSLHNVRCYWIGDSRVYFFGEQGLHQLTRDDSMTESDVFDATFESPPMSQFLAASMEREWRIHRQEFQIDCPGVLIACTDGCSADWKFPWAFELALQKALEQSDSWTDWLEEFKQLLEVVRSDDASMAIYPLATGKFAHFQKLRRRYQVTNAAVRANRAQQKVEARDAWIKIYQPVYETAPVAQAVAEKKTVIESCESARTLESQQQSTGSSIDDLIKASVVKVDGRVAAQQKAKTKIKRKRRLHISRSCKWLSLGWLFGLMCGLSLGTKVKPWLEYFAFWLKSLWQST